MPDIVQAETIWFQKQQFYNRYVIMAAQGKLRLTIPVLKPTYQKKLSDIRIDNSTQWGRTHIRAIESAYRKAPFFEQYHTELVQLFLQNHAFLTTFSKAALSLWLNALRMEMREIKGEKNLDKNVELSAPEAIITLLSDQIPALPEGFTYPTVFGEVFDKEVSLLDALFCAGPAYILRWAAPSP